MFSAYVRVGVCVISFIQFPHFDENLLPKSERIQASAKEGVTQQRLLLSAPFPPFTVAGIEGTFLPKSAFKYREKSIRKDWFLRRNLGC